MQKKNQRKYKQSKSHYSVQSSHHKQIQILQKKIKGQNKINEDYDKKICVINQKIEKQKSQLFCEYGIENESKQQVNAFLAKIIVEQKQLKQNINKLEQQMETNNIYLRNKNENIRKLKVQNEEHIKQGIHKLNQEELNKQLQVTKAKMQKLDDQIMCNQPLKYQEDLREAVHELSKQLQNKKELINIKKQEIQIKQLQQSILKSNLVVELGKYEQLKRQTQQKQQTLKSLHRHIQQIRQRVSAMKKQRKILKKSTITNNYEINKQIQKLQNQNQALAKDICVIQQKINEQEQCIAKFAQSQKQIQLQAQFHTLMNKYESIKNKINKPSPKVEIQKCIKLQSNAKLHEKNRKKIKKLQNIKDNIKVRQQNMKIFENQVRLKKIEIEAIQQQANKKCRQQNLNNQSQLKQADIKNTNVQEIQKENKNVIKIGSLSIKMYWVYSFVIFHFLALFLIYLWMGN